jgi:hypothetical protein
MSFDKILEELPKPTTEEKKQLRELLLDSELSWTEEEEQAIEEGIGSREEGLNTRWEKLDLQISEKHSLSATDPLIQLDLATSSQKTFLYYVLVAAGVYFCASSGGGISTFTSATAIC